jgi:hypothetical protein
MFRSAVSVVTERLRAAVPARVAFKEMKTILECPTPVVMHYCTMGTWGILPTFVLLKERSVVTILETRLVAIKGTVAFRQMPTAVALRANSSTNNA